MIEHFTYRSEGHSTSDDPSAYRPSDEPTIWPFGDPIARLKQHLIILGEWDEDRHAAQRTELDDLVKTTQKQSEKLGILGHGMHQPFETMFEDVFEEMPWHLKEQCDQMLAEQEAKFGPNWEARMMAPETQATTKTMNMIEAINSAMDVMLERDPNTVVMGEDVGYFGGVFRATAGLQKKHGKTRVFDTPINECGIIGVAVGMGAYGLRPVPEIQFADYIYPGLDQLVSEAARLRYRSAADFICPMTVRTPFGGGIFGGQTHSQSPESIMTHICGVKTVIPSNPYDAKGLLIAAIEDNDPVVFLEPKRIYNGPFSGYYDRPVEPWSKHEASAVPEGHYRIELGKAATVRAGEALTILVYGTMVHVTKTIVEEMGIDAEIIDLRTLLPLDIGAIEASVQKTGRCLIIHEATRTSGFGAELVALVQERCFYHLEAPVERVTGFDTPYPHSLEWAYFPGPVRIATALTKILKD